jgi:plastocyanin
VRTTALLLLCAGMLTASCSGASTDTPTTPSPPVAPNPPPQQPAVVTITASGFSPAEVSTTVGSRVTFVNGDSRPHELLGGPDHARQDCAEINVVGFLVPGQSRETDVFTAARVCEFHDHANVGNPAFLGRIVVR